MAKVTEFTACAECGSQSPIGRTRGTLDPLSLCPDCHTVEGRTRTLWANDETDEVTADQGVADAWEALQTAEGR